MPQLNSNSSNIELLDVNQIEFVRGPQSPLFGRNTLGGIVNVTSTRPSMSRWTGAVIAPFANAGAMEVRGNISGPLGDKAAISFAGGKQQRDGYTKNSVTGNDLDYRDGTFAKAQLLFLPTANWEARLIYAHERNRDGDYALGDLSAIRTAPYRVTRDYEGFTNRDINNTTVNLRGIGQNFAIESTTGFVAWDTEDETDLDYSPLPLAIRSNLEESTQFTQQVRISSPDNAPMALGSTMIKWQAGVEYFNQGYDQDAVNTLSAFVLSPQVGFPVAMHSPQSSIDTTGIGLFGRATFTFNDKADLTAGLRFDHESSDAHLNTFIEPAIAPANVVAAEDSYSDVSPQFAFGYRIRPEHTAYASVARGYKAGGFNPAALPGSEAYGEEHAWHVEAGVKSTLAAGKVSANAALFFINWDDLQLNVPNPFAPGQFYISNVGSARSRGIEFDITARPRPAIDLFAAVGFTSARIRGRHDGRRCRRQRQRAALHARLHRDVRRPVDARRSPPRSAATDARKSSSPARSTTTRATPRARRPTRSSTSAPAPSTSGCSPSSGCVTRSRRDTCRSRFRIRDLRRRASSARMAARGRSASVSEPPSRSGSGDQDRDRQTDFARSAVPSASHLALWFPVLPPSPRWRSCSRRGTSTP